MHSVDIFWFTLLLVAQAQVDEGFNCTFTGEDLVCYCSASSSNDPLFWWDGNSMFCSFTVVNNSSVRNESNWVVEVFDISPSGGLTSKLTLRNISPKLNGTEIGCTHTSVNSRTCRPSSTDQQSSYTLCFTTCRGQ